MRLVPLKSLQDLEQEYLRRNRTTRRSGFLAMVLTLAFVGACLAMTLMIHEGTDGGGGTPHRGTIYGE